MNSRPQGLTLGALGLALIVGLAGCELLADGTSAERVTARVEGERLFVGNQTTEPVYLFAVGRQMAAVINWAATVDGPALDPGTTQTFALRDLALNAAETELLVYWWSADDANASQPGPIEAVIVDLGEAALPLRIEVEEDTLVLTNDTRAPVYTFVVDPATLARIRWAPTLETEPLQPGQIVRTSFPEGEDTLVVFWWPADTAVDPPVPGWVRMRTVSIAG
ncbi:MAG: hypothetical protein AAGI71_16720 [Bacteroidota bacterium]